MNIKQNVVTVGIHAPTEQIICHSTEHSGVYGNERTSGGHGKRERDESRETTVTGEIETDKGETRLDDEENSARYQNFDNRIDYTG